VFMSFVITVCKGMMKFADCDIWDTSLTVRHKIIVCM
jgi:hypothetical protein